MMSPLVLVVMLVVAFGFSWVTANSAGRLWTESKVIGGMLRVMVIASVVMAAIGFTGVYLATLAVAATAFGMLDSSFINMVFVPLAGLLGMSGVGAAPNLWVNSQVAVRRQQAIAAAAVPGPPMIISPLDILGIALDSPGLVDRTDGFLNGLFKGFGGGSHHGGGSGIDLDVDSDSAPILAIIVLAAISIFALCAGIVTTILIVEHADREHVGEVFDLYRTA